MSVLWDRSAATLRALNRCQEASRPCRLSCTGMMTAFEHMHIVGAHIHRTARWRRKEMYLDRRYQATSVRKLMNSMSQPNSTTHSWIWLSASHMPSSLASACPSALPPAKAKQLSPLQRRVPALAPTSHVTPKLHDQLLNLAQHQPHALLLWPLSLPQRCLTQKSKCSAIKDLQHQPQPFL